jgi:molybdopterin/thiamine biosynthesis adenylyltransferase
VHAAIAGFTGQVATILPLEKSGCFLFENQQTLDRGIETTLGNPAVTPALAATLQAQEVVKLITGVGEPLCGKMLYFDLGCNLFEIIRLEK